MERTAWLRGQLADLGLSVDDARLPALVAEYDDLRGRVEGLRTLLGPRDMPGPLDLREWRGASAPPAADR